MSVELSVFLSLSLNCLRLNIRTSHDTQVSSHKHITLVFFYLVVLHSKNPKYDKEAPNSGDTNCACERVQFMQITVCVCVCVCVCV